MKKKFFSIVFIAVIAIVAALSISQSEEEIVLTDIALSNVEALANVVPPVKDCPGGTVLCAKGPGTTLYEKSGK